MDSGNTSGSLHSSSGDDQDTSTTPNFLMNNNYTVSSHDDHVGQSLSMFVDPLSNFFVDNNNNTNSVDTIWSKGLRSEQNCTDSFGGFMAATSSTPSFKSRSHHDDHVMQFSRGLDNINATKESVTGSGRSSTGGGHSSVGVRNPKKRSRASRRAPTTVLTTDTTNFRAMVQEFTGIPAAPFTSSLFPRTAAGTRLDLFGSSTRSTTNLFDHTTPPPYLLKPFPQKPLINIPFNLNNTTTSPSLASTNPGNINSNYQQQSQLNLLNNMQNPFLNFQPNNKYTLLEPSKHQPSEIPSSTDQLSSRHLKMGFLENEFTGSGGGGGLSSSSQEGIGGGGFLRSINGASSSNGNNVNLSSEFHLDKAAENVARSEGMVESWICSSD